MGAAAWSNHHCPHPQPCLTPRSSKYYNTYDIFSKLLVFVILLHVTACVNYMIARQQGSGAVYEKAPHTAVIRRLHGCYMAVTWLLHDCYMVVTWLLHDCSTTIT